MSAIGRFLPFAAREDLKPFDTVCSFKCELSQLAALARTISFPWILFVLMYVPPGEVYFSGVIAHEK